MYRPIESNGFSVLYYVGYTGKIQVTPKKKVREPKELGILRLWSYILEALFFLFLFSVVITDSFILLFVGLQTYYLLYYYLYFVACESAFIWRILFCWETRLWDKYLLCWPYWLEIGQPKQLNNLANTIKLYILQLLVTFTGLVLSDMADAVSIGYIDVGQEECYLV